MPTFPLGKPLAYWQSQYALAGYNNAYNVDWDIDAVDATHFGSSLHRASQPGLIGSSVSFAGHYINTAPDTYEDIVIAAKRTETVNTVAMTGGAVGDLADLWTATSISRSVALPVDDLIGLDTEHYAKDGVHSGAIMVAETAVSGSPFSTTGYDFGGASWPNDSTLYTWLVHLHVLAYTSGLAAVLVQTSPDNSTWTTRGTFAAISAVGGYRLALNTILHRYVRLRDTGVGTIVAAVAQTY